MFSRIVVAVAKSETARRAAEVATDLANRYGAQLHLVMAFGRGGADHDDRPGAESFLEACVRQGPPGAQTHAIPGDPAEAVLMVAREVGADLIVVGNRGMRGARRVLGSVPNSIAHGAECSVLIADTTS